MDWFDWADMTTDKSEILDRRRKGEMTGREKKEGRGKLGRRRGREESRTERA